MKRSIFVLFALVGFAASAFADIPGPNKKPRPTPRSTVPTAKIEPTPAPGPKGSLAEYDGAIRLYFDKTVDVPVLEIRRSAMEKLIASNGGSLDNDTLAAISPSSMGNTQTIVSGVLFSLAFIVGGIWIFRSKGSSKTAAGILLGVALGAGTMVLANSPPPSLVTLTSRIFNNGTTVYGYAANKVKIRLIEEKEYLNGDRSDDVVLRVPKVKNEGEGDE
jgi:hypothetical protein